MLCLLIFLFSFQIDLFAIQFFSSVFKGRFFIDDHFQQPLDVLLCREGDTDLCQALDLPTLGFGKQTDFFDDGLQQPVQAGIR